MTTTAKRAAPGAANTESSEEGTAVASTIPNNDYCISGRDGQELIRDGMAVVRAVLDTITEDEARELFDEIYNAEREATVDPWDILDEDALNELLGGEIIALEPVGDGNGLLFTIRTNDGSVVSLDGSVDFYVPRRDDERFETLKRVLVDHGRLSPEGREAVVSAVGRLVRRRARAILEQRKRDKEGVGGVDI